MSSSRVALPLCLVALLLSPLFSRQLNPSQYEGGRSRDALERAQRNQSAVGVMLGEFRTAAADLIFVKTERYMDSGVAYMPHVSEEEVYSVSGEARSITEHEAEVAEGIAEDHHDEHDHDGDGHQDHEAHEHDHGEGGGTVDTIIKTRDKDFRGFIGDLHRKVKPWSDPKQHMAHTPGDELLPWYRIMTLTDPHNTRGYTIGAWWLKAQAPDQALEFINEGLEKNPDSFQVHLMRGRVLISLAEKKFGGRAAAMAAPEGRKFLEDAVTDFVKAVDLALKIRPATGPQPPEVENPVWDGGDEDDLLAAMRLAVLTSREVGNEAGALDLARKYVSILRHDAILEHLIERMEKGAE